MGCEGLLCCKQVGHRRGIGVPVIQACCCPDGCQQGAPLLTLLFLPPKDYGLCGSCCMLLDGLPLLDWCELWLLLLLLFDEAADAVRQPLLALGDAQDVVGEPLSWLRGRPPVLAHAAFDAKWPHSLVSRAGGRHTVAPTLDGLP